ncbi:MAG: PGPGW domain-containing protein [Thermoleophilia bacterium]
MLRPIAGAVLLGIGLLGLLLPILPGWLLIFVGLALLGVRLPVVERLKARLLTGRHQTDAPPRGATGAPPDAEP